MIARLMEKNQSDLCNFNEGSLELPFLNKNWVDGHDRRIPTRGLFLGVNERGAIYDCIKLFLLVKKGYLSTRE